MPVGLILAMAVADLAVFATLVAVILQLPKDDGAVYSPSEEIEPHSADHTTEVLEVPVTVAEYCCVSPGARFASDGETLIFTGLTTVILTEEAALLSAWLVAVIMHCAGPDGAVYRPEVEIVPQDADHVTAVLPAPDMEAVN